MRYSRHDNEHKPPKALKQEQGRKAKKPYTSPRLEAYGLLQNITLGGPSQGDSGNPLFSGDM